MKRHIEYFYQPDQNLKDRSRFWTWYMRGLHGDMDTRYEGDRRSSSRASLQVRTTDPNAHGFNFRPLASNTYGYHPKGVTTRSRPSAGLAAVAALNEPDFAPLDKRPEWSTPLKSLDDMMLLRDPHVRSASLPRRPIRSSIDPALDDLINRHRPLWPRRGLFNRLWRPSLFWDDDALLKPGSWINDPWWHKYPELRPLDLAVPSYTRTEPGLRKSYLSPVKRTYVWGYHPLRPNGYHSY